MKTAIDEAFIGRVYRTSAFLWAFGLLICLSFLAWRAALGWTLGSAMSAGILRSLELVIRRDFVPGAGDAGAKLAKFSLVKLPVVLVFLSAVVLLGKGSPALIFTFCAGAVLTQAVIFLKVLGMLLVQRSDA